MHGRNVGGMLKLDINDHIVHVDKRRLTAEKEANKTSSLTLAAKNTNRKDPLDDFNLYTGGWNISNEHYWAVRFFLYCSNNVHLVLCETIVCITFVQST